MATIKSYTDIEQAKKLAEILPLESADMYYIKDSLENYYCPIPLIGKYSAIHDQIPCWSLAALLNALLYALPSATLDSSSDHHFRIHCMERDTEWYDNAVDACVEMILKLNNLKLLQ